MAQLAEQARAPARADAPVPPAAPGRDLSPLLLVVAVLVALVPIVLDTARALDNHWLPVGDNAIVYARTTDVFSADTPLLFMWSAGSTWAEEAFNNPGPAMYWVLAVPTTVFGPPGMAIATALLNGACLVGLAIVGRRRGGPLVGMAAVAVAATLAWTMGSGLLMDPWPPNSLLLVTLLYLALVWSAADGDLTALPWVAGTGTLLLQTNLSYALLAPGLALLAVIALGLHLRRQRRREPEAWPALRQRARRVGWATAAVLVVGWAPTVVEQLTADGTGNLTRIVRGMGELPLSLGPERALRLLAGVVALPSWVSRDSFGAVYDRPPSTAAAVVVAVVVGVVLGGLAWLAARHGDRLAVAGIATATCALALAFVTTARSPVGGLGDLAAYRTRFLWAVVAFAVLVVVVAAARRLPEVPNLGLAEGAVLVAVTAMLAAAGVPTHWVSGGNHEPGYANEVVRELRSQLTGLDLDQTVLFDWRGDSVSYPYWAYGVIADLVRRDVPLKVHDPLLVRTLGEHRRYDGDGDADVLMTVRTGERAHFVPPGARRIALREGLRPAERDELRVLREDLVNAVDNGEVRLTPEAERRLGRLGGDRAQADETPPNRQLLQGRNLQSLLHQGFLDLGPTWEPRIGRYLYLQLLLEDQTIGVFVRPLGSRGTRG
jgi:hypothetical protein